ncbi:hypothetical protein [uncultured Jannaschia sp.]|uniref:hypothetical protein n=1 Tax=uncultured Jannaschia sp. TaxID=293347 RepID=UPI002638ADD7|nr:hypothetical protein [uncultured Jannaschia sp.]
MDVRVAANSRLILPGSLRDAMGLTVDIKVHLTVEGDVVRFGAARPSRAPGTGTVPLGGQNAAHDGGLPARPAR